jgi:hypothetical protein
LVSENSLGARRASAQTKALAALVLAAVFCLAIPASALAAASYVFEPTLSLTGNCATSAKLDPVPDPGTCPIPPGTVFSGAPGADHPSTRLEAPSVTVDSFGDIYVVNMLQDKGRIDVFGPDGTFITEFADTTGPQSIAVDSKGNVYLFERFLGKSQIRRFPPSAYEPLKGNIEYGVEPVLIANNSTKVLIPLEAATTFLAVNPTDDRLYVDNSVSVAVFGTAAEENKLLEKEAITGLERSQSFALDAKHKKIYIADRVPITLKSTVRIFELEAPHKGLGQINGSTTPKGEYLSGEGNLQIDVDEETGHLFVGDIFAANKVYEFEESGAYIATIEHSFEASVGPGGIVGEIAVDNGSESPHQAWLFVPSVPSPSAGHVYAFEPNEECEAKIESTSVGDITETEATLHATINPCGLETTYRFEYVSQEQFEASGFAEATLAGEATLPKGGEGLAVSAPASELEPATEYRFLVLAENAKGEGKEEGAFKTFPPVGEAEPCENEALRIGLSALLPDCRAYELVTPADTNGRPPSAGFAGVYFPTLRAAPDGNSATFVIEGGLIPGSEGTGAFNGDNYLATRGNEGWTSELAGPRGEEVGITAKPSPGGVSPDQAYSFWEDTSGIYIHYPDGHSELVGRGSLGEDPRVEPNLITEGAAHIVFQTTHLDGHVPQQLEANAPPTGTTAVYDRSAEGSTHVVSLLPGDVTPPAKEDARYLGASEDGEGIAFEIKGTIYLRLHSAETFEVAGPGSTFASVAAGGTRVFYTKGGDLFAFDTEEPVEPIAFSESGDITPVNVAEDGTRAYFVSPSVLSGEEENPNGEKAKEGKEGAQNLYLSEEGTLSFVAQVTKRDVEGEEQNGLKVNGLGLWLSGVKAKAPAIDPSRTTPAGDVLLFESRADLTGFDSNGFAQVYRYDQAQKSLTCLSCSPTKIPSTSDANLQSISKEQFSPEPGGSFLKIPNQNPAGTRAFFETAEPLAVDDTDSRLDVYEWEEKEVGSCKAEGGCIYLISGGQSSGPDYLFAMSQSGNDVLFRTSDQLLDRDSEATLSIYDARVGGGFPEGNCEGGGCCNGCCGGECRPLSPPPAVPGPTTSTVGPGGNVEEPKHCPKGKRAVKRHGKRACVKSHKKKHHRGTGSKKKGGAR